MRITALPLQCSAAELEGFGANHETAVVLFINLLNFSYFLWDNDFEFDARDRKEGAQYSENSLFSVHMEQYLYNGMFGLSIP